ncbi:MAG: PHP domain-containing protein, partial [FCB group bacterium]|nr:PHP domain-containing protein [FCB group bacterium]
MENRPKYEAQLNDFDPQVRREALDKLLDLVERRLIALPEPVSSVNLHSHTFYSYNGYGYSPTAFAWKARLAGLAVAGVVDFDVLDAVDEFLEAARRLGLKACAGLETRIFVPEYGDREINSPGEPGISYHMGAGFTSSSVKNGGFLAGMKTAAQSRNRAILERVNPYLAPAELDYERDVLPLTPNGNATERHLCMAYDARAAEVFPEDAARAKFWAEKLKEGEDRIQGILNDPAALQG